MRTKEQINEEYSRTVAELGLLVLQQGEFPARVEAMKQRIYQLRQEHLEAAAKPAVEPTK